MDKLSTILILSNPQGKKRQIGKVSNEIISILTDKNIRFENPSQWPTDISDYKEVWLIGGDGTLHYFINQYRDISIPIVMFKGGTGNDLAWKLYGEMKIEAQVRHVLDCTAIPVDAVRCNDKLFINGIGIGFDGEVLKSMRSIRMIGGHAGYLLAVIKKIFSYKELYMKIEIGENRLEGKYLLAFACNSSRMGGGFMVSPQSDISDGIINVILCKPLGILKRLRYLPIIEKGKHLDLPFISQYHTTSITITCSKKVPAQIDGELIYDDKFDIKILPGKFLFKY